MNRSPNDRRVRRIMAAIERAIASPHRGACGSPGLPCQVASCIVSFGEFGEDFMGWNDDAVRAVMLAYALNAPEEDLRAMATEAHGQIRWVEEWDAHGCRDAGACVLVTRIVAA